MSPTAPDARQEVVTYDGLPTSSGGAHGLRARSPETALTQVHAFLDACTVPEVPARWEFQVSTAGDADATATLVAATRDALGGPQQKASTHTSWRVDPTTVSAALDVLAAAGPGAVTRYGHPLASLTCTAPVLLLNPATHVAYPGISPQELGEHAVDGYGRLLGASGVRATLGTSASRLSLWLNLPGDDRLVPGAQHIQEHLPFRLSAKHWRRWRPTRTGGYRSTREPSPLTQPT